MSESDYRRAFGDRVREARERRGFSQEGFAHHVGMDRTYVSGIERGVRNPTLIVICRIADGLDLHPSELLRTLPGHALDEPYD